MFDLMKSGHLQESERELTPARACGQSLLWSAGEAETEGILDSLQPAGAWPDFWRTADKRLVLSGIRSATGSVSTSTASSLQTLVDAWAPVFAHKPIDSVTAESISHETVAPVEHHLLRMPGPQKVSAFLARAHHSAPGPDGLPYLAWRLAGESAHYTIYRLLLHVAQGLNTPMHFNASTTSFLAKGSEAEDDGLNGVIRAMSDVRPLTMKCSGNTTIAGVLTCWSMNLLKPYIYHTQAGFIPGRQLTANIAEVDSYSRIGSVMHFDNVSFRNSAPVDEIPVMAFFDFCAAVPSHRETMDDICHSGDAAPVRISCDPELALRACFHARHAPWHHGLHVLVPQRCRSGVPFLRHLVRILHEPVPHFDAQVCYLATRIHGSSVSRRCCWRLPSPATSSCNGKSFPTR